MASLLCRRVLQAPLLRRALATEAKEVGLLTSVVSEDDAAAKGSTKAKGSVHVEQVRNVKHSPRKMNMLAKLIRGMPLEAAMRQMRFSPKRHAQEIYDALKRASAAAPLTKNMDRSKLFVAEAYTNKGQFLKRIEFKGRGRTGIRHHPRSHVILKFKELVPVDKRQVLLDKLRKRELRPHPMVPRR